MLKIKLLALAIEGVLTRLSPDLLKKVADKILDVIENAIEDSATEWDDRLLLPLINQARVAFDIPDEDVIG